MHAVADLTLWQKREVAFHSLCHMDKRRFKPEAIKHMKPTTHGVVHLTKTARKQLFVLAQRRLKRAFNNATRHKSLGVRAVTRKTFWNHKITQRVRARKPFYKDFPVLPIPSGKTVILPEFFKPYALHHYPFLNCLPRIMPHRPMVKTESMIK